VFLAATRKEREASAFVLKRKGFSHFLRMRKRKTLEGLFT
jgi:hypothetical protein